MLITITTTRPPATDLGYLLGKHPERAQTFSLSFGAAHVFYPERTPERCTVALLLDIDPVRLVRAPKGAEAFALGQYTNDRPYVGSSFLAVAIHRVFRTGLTGRSAERPALATAQIPLEIRLTAMPVRGGQPLIERLFEPLGYAVTSARHPLDAAHPEWGDSAYHTITLRAHARLADALRHLVVLIPVLDNDKHYWVGEAEVEKLMNLGADWLADHPHAELITRRYLRHQRGLTRAAMGRLVEEAETPADIDAAGETAEAALEAPASLNSRRMDAVVQVLERHDARAVIDLGCGGGKLLRRLLQKSRFERIVGVDVAPHVLEVAHRRLRLDRLSDRQRKRIQLLHGSLVYRDARFRGFDAAVAVEVIEHLDASRLEAFEVVLFDTGARVIVVTTPNREHNVLFENLPPDQLRHRDHRFEWTRAEFRAWAEPAAERHGYSVAFTPIGDVDPTHGAPTQMAVFTR